MAVVVDGVVETLVAVLVAVVVALLVAVLIGVTVVVAVAVEWQLFSSTDMLLEPVFAVAMSRPPSPL